MHDRTCLQYSEMRDAAPSSKRGEALHTGGFAPLQSTPQAMSLTAILILALPGFEIAN